MTVDVEVISATAVVEYERLFDPGTGLPGVALLLDRIEMALARARRLQRHVGVLYFADVQPMSRGPADEVVGARFRSFLRADDTLARVAAHSFVVVCCDLDCTLDARVVGLRLLEQAAATGRWSVAVGTTQDSARELLCRAARFAVAAPIASGPECGAVGDHSTASRSTMSGDGAEIIHLRSSVCREM